MTRHLDVRAGSYHDSVSLMQVSQVVSGSLGVRTALVAMATELNLDLLTGMGFEPPPGAGSNDLLVAVDAEDDDALARALDVADTALTQRTDVSAGGFGDRPTARTVGSAARRSDATVAFVSTPGRYAFLDAMDALHSGLCVVVFSDNVAFEQEVRLKRTAEERDLLVMGPDCGTAVVGGVGFGFANVVRPGPVGLVAASGTGAQHLMSLVDAVGVGVSHCLGVGGRDLSEPVGGTSTLAALDMLATDDATEVVVVVGKPPAPQVADRVRARAATIGKPVLFALLSEGQPDLTEAARSAVEAAGGAWAEPAHWPAPHGASVSGRCVRGLFSGGTLCDEAMVLAAAALGRIRSNIPLRPDWGLGDDWSLGADVHLEGHVMLDFGDDALTQGRPHPMIDGSLRAERMLAEAADPACGVILLDVVLGHGAHPDPASELASAISAARARAADHGRDVAVVASLIGTPDDPQGLYRQAKALVDAGASVHLSNAAAAREAVHLVGGQP